MPTDLLTFNPRRRSIAQMYRWATCLRLFRPATDGRSQFWTRIPGVRNVHTRASLSMTNFNAADPLLSHHLVELDDGWLSLYGGTEFPGGWPYHAWSLIEFPLPDTKWFPSYWWSTAGWALTDIATAIPAGDDRPITFIGHSLGGATAVASAYRDFDRPTSRSRFAVTFGAPLVRAKAGMDDREIPCCRVLATDDAVASLPQHFVRIGTTIPSFKIPLFSLYPYGTATTIKPNGDWELGETGFWRDNVVGLAGALFNAAFQGWKVWVPHYMQVYAMRLRQGCAWQGDFPEAIWDEINAYINRAEGIIWDIEGYPLSAPPALPGGFTPPPSVNLPAILASMPDLRGYSSDLLHPRPLVPITEGQSLADAISVTTGRDLADVTVHLSQAPVADPLNVELNSFSEADFSGYQFFGGPKWVTTPAQPWTTARRYAARAVFSCIGEERINTAHAWYMVGHVRGTGERQLLDWRNLNVPFLFNRPRSLVIEFSLSMGTA